ncbi:MAG: glutamate racemase [Bacteroidales bacterium]
MMVFFYFYIMSKSEAPIGMFDSGLGGLSVWKVVSAFLPRESFIYYADSRFAPYGSRSREEIIERSMCITDLLLKDGAKLIVVACNTATAAAIDFLRESHPDIPFVGMEPAIKPASLLSETGNVGVLATQGTFSGALFKRNREKYNPYVKIHFREGEGLVELAEKNMVNSAKAERLLRKYIEPMMQAQVDQLVLGCTHYPLFIPLIRRIAGDSMKIIDPADAIARRTKDLLMQHRKININQVAGKSAFFTSGKLQNLERMLISLVPDQQKSNISHFSCD